MMGQILGIAISLALAAEPDSAPLPPNVGEQQITTNGLAELSIRELTKWLPPAGTEWTWDARTRGRIADAAVKEMTRRLELGVHLTDDDWRAALLSTGALRFRTCWPRNEDYSVSMTIPEWLGIAQIRIRPVSSGMTPAQVGVLMTSDCGVFRMSDTVKARTGFTMGRVPPDTHSLTFEVEVERGRDWRDRHGNSSPPPGMLWKGVITQPVELVEAFDEVLQGATSAQLEKGVRDAIGASIQEWGEDKKAVACVTVDPDCTRFPELETTALDLKLMLVAKGKVLEESCLLALDNDLLAVRANTLTRNRVRYFGCTCLEIPVKGADTSDWVIRLTGVSDHTWAFWNARQRWNGTIEIPWSEALERESKRAGPQGRNAISTPIAN